MRPRPKDFVPTNGVCPDCGKVRYLPRSDAKAASRRLVHDHDMSPYRCGEFWHFGTLAPVIRRGMAVRPQQSQHSGESWT